MISKGGDETKWKKISFSPRETPPIENKGWDETGLQRVPNELFSIDWLSSYFGSSPVPCMAWKLRIWARDPTKFSKLNTEIQSDGSYLFPTYWSTLHCIIFQFNKRAAIEFHMGKTSSLAFIFLVLGGTVGSQMDHLHPNSRVGSTMSSNSSPRRTKQHPSVATPSKIGYYGKRSNTSELHPR
jgi:hypothetical protein